MAINYENWLVAEEEEEAPDLHGIVLPGWGSCRSGVTFYNVTTDISSGARVIRRAALVGGRSAREAARDH